MRVHLEPSQVRAGVFSGTDSSGFKKNCAGILYPETDEQVAYIAKCASRWKIAIDPISTGFNVGYGDYLPEKSAQVLVDLRRMNKILELNREEGWLRIQAGVTQAQVAEYLREYAPELSFDLTYWIKESSVIGNALERGRTVLAERERDLIGAKLALANGEFLRTGYTPIGKSPLVHGLNLHPLIFQSNLGIVVEGILKVRPVDVRSRYALAGFGTFHDFARGLEALNLQPTNSARMLRWFCLETFGESPTPTKVKQRMTSSAGGVLALELDRSVTNAAMAKLLRASVSSISKEKLMTAPPLEKLNDLGPMSFFSFTVRRSSRDFLTANRFIGCLRRQFPLRFFVTISFLDSSAVFLLRVHGDPARQSKTTRAHFREISRAIEKHGYVLYRNHSGIPTKHLPDARLKKMIKTCFDPKGVISPGRYGLQ